MDMSINPNTNLRCDRKTVNETRWCEDHKDEWCDQCGRHAIRIVVSPEGALACAANTKART